MGSELDRQQIIMNFQRAKEQANKLDAIASQLSKLSDNDLEMVMGAVNSNWKGESASLYLNKGDRLQERMDGSAETLHSIAEQIRTIALRIYNAEMASLSIAESRTYG